MFEDLANKHSGFGGGSVFGGGSIFDSGESIFGGSGFDSLNQMENYGELRDNPNNYFNFKAQHLGTIGVVERMAGLVANREDLSFGDISLAESYKDGALNTRVMGGIYNKTLTDMYKNKDDFLRLQGAFTLGGMIKGNNDAEIEMETSIFENKTTSNISPFENKTASNILTSKGVGQSNYLEGDTIYGQLDSSVKKKDDTKKVSMSDLLDNKNKELSQFDNVKDASPFDNVKAASPFDNPNAKYLSSDGVGGTKGYIEGSTIYEKKENKTVGATEKTSMRDVLEAKKGDAIKNFKHTSSATQEFSVPSVSKNTSKITPQKKNVSKAKLDKMLEDSSVVTPKKESIDTLKVTRDANQKTFSEKEEKKAPVRVINTNLEKMLDGEKNILKAPKLELKAKKIEKKEAVVQKIEIKEKKVFTMD